MGVRASSKLSLVPVRPLVGVLCVAGSALSAYAQPVRPGVVVMQDGDTVGSSTVTGLGEAYTNNLGQAGFVALLADGSRSIVINGVQVFNSLSVAGVTGSEDTMGISDAGGFIYSPSVNGEDAVYTQAGPLLVSGSAAPGLPGLFNSFNSRPRMAANGTAFWVAGWANTATGSSVGRVLYKCTNPADPSTISIVLRSGDVIDGATIAASGVGFGYDISSDATKFINSAIFTGATTADTGIVTNADGTLRVVAREGSASGAGDNWQNFSAVAINAGGTYLFTGDTDGATSADAYLAINGTIALREGTTLDNVPLGGTTTAVSVSDANTFAIIWNTGALETLFYGTTAAPGSARAIATVNDLLDVNNDSVGDFVINDFNASNSIAPGLDLASDGFIYANVDITPVAGGTPLEAIVRFSTTTGGPTCDSIDFNNDTLTPDSGDLDDFIAVLSGGPSACSTFPTPGCNDLDFNNDGLFPDSADLDAFISRLAGGACV